ncbi:MAG: zinc-ribbon domain-containing protein [Lachnospiraceae bacterium]|nr:zinc-ribbon domain-containing protein [Lachnospiraceae bacterium]
MALVKCPECSHEISDTAKHCPNCGYRKKKYIDMKIIILCALIIIIAVCISFWVKNPIAIIGEWRIDSYIVEGNCIKQDDIGEYYGEIYQTGNSAFSVVFDKNGTVALSLPTFEGTKTVRRECEYEIDGNKIYLLGNGDRTKGFEINGNTLIVYNIATFDGDVILKKK